MATAVPDAVLARAEEFFDWVIDAKAARAAGVSPWAPETPTHTPVVRLDGAGLQPLFQEPNPRRASGRADGLMPQRPAYADVDSDAVSLRPPPGLLDNRLVRRAGPESDIADVRGDQDAMYRQTLTTSDTAALLRRELASPRYRLAPDIVPIWFDAAAAVRVSFGAVDSQGGVWLMNPEEARAAAAFAKTAAGLETLYALQIATSLGAPDWLDGLADGKRFRMATTFTDAFRPLLRWLSTAAAPVVLFRTHRTGCGPFLSDHAARTVSADVYVAELPPAASGR